MDAVIYIFLVSVVRRFKEFLWALSSRLLHSIGDLSGEKKVQLHCCFSLNSTCDTSSFLLQFMNKYTVHDCGRENCPCVTNVTAKYLRL